MDRYLANGFEYRLMGPPPSEHIDVTTTPFQDANNLLAVYPMASVTPSTHVARHLNHLSIGEPVPFFSQAGFSGSHPQGNPPPYTEYATELEHLSTFQTPTHDLEYWESTRSQVLGLLRDQTQMGSPYMQPSQPSLLPPSTNFQTSPLMHTVFQGSIPSLSYPTPPPGMATSSSSLALALGEPTSRSSHNARQSRKFFGDFLSKKIRETDAHPGSNPYHPNPPGKSETVSSKNSDAWSANSPLDKPTHTPRKRKPIVHLESPSVKRFQSTPHGSTVHSDASSPSHISPTVTPPTKKVATLAYVEIPPSPWLTPSSSSKRVGQGVQNTMNVKNHGGLGSGYSPAIHGDTLKSSARRTGDRDDRVPLEKFIALLEDIFEAEDLFSPDAKLDDLPSEIVASLTADCSHLMLQPTVTRKLTKYIDQVSRPTRRSRSAVHESATVSGSAPRAKWRMAEVDVSTLSRILKILEQCVRAGDDLDPFLTTSSNRQDSIPARKTSSTKTFAGRFVVPSSGKKERLNGSSEPESAETTSRNLPNSEADSGRLTTILDIARDSVLAADCCIALLGSDRLSKQLYSEELITACLGTIKNQLTRLIYPFVEACADTSSHVNPLLQQLVDTTTAASKDHRRQVHEIFQALSAVLPRLSVLVGSESVALSDMVIIQAVYIAIGPFFVVESKSNSDNKPKKHSITFNTLGKNAIRVLRLDALSLIRNIFANYEDQRSWIVEEILMSLIKLSDAKQKAGQFRLRDGRSIRTVSALLLQLVQTSAHDVHIEAQRIEKARRQNSAVHRQDCLSGTDLTSRSFLDEFHVGEIELYSNALESATKVARTIVLFLTQRSGKGKASKTSNEAEYRVIFDNLISDLLVVVYWPEWPAATLLLSVAIKYMILSLDDIKTINQADSNAAKTLALDHLGVIAARIRSSALRVEQAKDRDEFPAGALKSMDELLTSANTKDLNALLAAHRDVRSHLCKRSSEDQAYESARELQAAILGQELVSALKQINSWVSETGRDECEKKTQRETMVSLCPLIQNALRDIWTEPAVDVFDIGSSDEVFRIDRLAELIGITQGLSTFLQPILSVILSALDAPPVFVRTKALRALGQIVISDPKILSASNVRRAIENHLLDSSPAVRDAAVELIGKYIVESPGVAEEYYQKIADRIADTGVGVRKRVIKLLKAYYYVTYDNVLRVDISTRLILRMLDEDDGVKELAVRTLEDLWFQNAMPMSNSSFKAPALSSLRDNDVLQAKVAVVMGVSAHFKDRQSPLENMLCQIVADKDGEDATFLHARYAEICGVLIDGLVDASDLPGFTVISCVRTIYHLTSAYPAVLSDSSASILLPYLKNATTADEQGTSDYLLKIFRSSIPHMPKTALKFGNDLQLILQPMIIKPSAVGGLQTLQETVSCFCIVVQHLTHDFLRLVTLIKSCNDRIQQVINRASDSVMAPNEARTLSILMLIVALLSEHFDFDRLKIEHPGIASELSTMCQGSVVEHIYECLLKVYDKFGDWGLRGRVLHCLGFVFRAQPTLMTVERSATIMDAIFSSPDEDGRARLLKIIQDFLVSEAANHSAMRLSNTKMRLKKAVDMEELVGNTDGFADSGVSSAVVQRYLDPILQAALSQQPQIQATAIDVLSFIIKLGLAHPLQSFPVIVALESSPIAALSARASSLHAVMHSKHMSLLNTRYMTGARASFDYQKSLSPDGIQGYRMNPTPDALLQGWYSLVRDKRGARQDFLRSLIKVFDIDTKLESSQDDVDFARYMAENFSALNYKTQEEVYTVIQHLTSVLSTAGMQLVEVLSPSHLLAQLGGPAETRPGPSMADMTPFLNGNSLTLPVLKSSVIIGMVILLRAYLKSLYGISEEKCSRYDSRKKMALTDKPATKRHDIPLSWDRLPFATVSLLTTQDMDHQKHCFLSIWDEDGLGAEPGDDL